MKEVNIPLKIFKVTCTSSRYRQDENLILGELVHSLEAHFASERQEPFVYTTYPSLWQHFKDVVFPQWLKKKLPVKLKENKITVDLVYPKLKTQLPLNLMGPYVTLVLADRHPLSFMPDVAQTVSVFREKAYERLLSEQRLDFRTCPYCQRSIFE